MAPPVGRRRSRSTPAGVAARLLQAMGAEGRAAPELLSFALAAGPLSARSAQGDGHAVIVLPGLGGDDASTVPLRWFLRALGYRPVGWGLGTNRGFGQRVSDGLDALVARHRDAGDVSLVGWSLGGVHAVSLARRSPQSVRSVITLGSPLTGVRPPASVPTTSIYSRSDRIVPWRRSVLRPAPRHESVEVRGSHLGLGHNTSVAAVVADRLVQHPDTWQPFRSAQRQERAAS